MKICIPTETDQGEQAKVYGHFGSAPFFTIYDTEPKSFEIIKNEHAEHAHGMCQPMAALSGKNVGAVVTGGAGARAVEKLNQGGVRVYRAVSGTVAEIVASWNRKELEELLPENACTDHDCH